MNKQGISEKSTLLREESPSEYNLEQSEKGIGQLYPILEAKDGEIIDGFHREATDKNWKRVVLEHIDTEEKKLIARLVANYHRRDIPDEEIAEFINRLAEIYRKRGLSSRALIRNTPTPIIRNEIVAEIAKTGISRRKITDLLRPEFKQTEQARTKEQVPTRKKASEVIEKAFPSRKDYGKHLVERHREEVLAEERPKIERAVREKTAIELLADKDFQQRVLVEISKPKVVTSSEPCPSGVCELPPVIESGKPVDIRAEALERFWKDNPSCLCKNCSHYGKCGVIR